MSWNACCIVKLLCGPKKANNFGFFKEITIQSISTHQSTLVESNKEFLGSRMKMEIGHQIMKILSGWHLLILLQFIKSNIFLPPWTYRNSYNTSAYPFFNLIMLIAWMHHFLLLKSQMQFSKWNLIGLQVQMDFLCCSSNIFGALFMKMSFMQFWSSSELGICSKILITHSSHSFQRVTFLSQSKTLDRLVFAMSSKKSFPRSWLTVCNRSYKIL